MDILKEAEKVISDYETISASKAEFDKLKGDCEVLRLMQYLLDKGRNISAEIDKLAEQATTDPDSVHFLEHYLKLQELRCINSTFKFISEYKPSQN